MKNIVFFACLSLFFIVFNGCIMDDDDCFRVTYSLNSADAEGDAPVDVNRYNENDIVVVLDTDAVRPGFDFTGWNTQADGSGTAYLPGGTFTITADVTLYAQWEEVILIDIVYLSNDGSGVSYTDTAISGEAYTLLTPSQAGISRPNFSFTVWNTEGDGSGTTYSAGDVISSTEDVILYAQWEGAVTFAVTYLPNDGDGDPRIENVVVGEVHTFLTDEDLGFSRVGYTFEGWNTEPDGTGTSYAPGSSETVTGPLTLYAQWVPLPQFTITYNPGLGDGGTQVTLPQGTPHTVLTEEQANVSFDLFSLASWNTGPDGSGTPYLPGSVITVSQNLTLYAQWVFNP